MLAGLPVCLYGVYQFCTAVSHQCLYGVYQFCTAVSHQRLYGVYQFCTAVSHKCLYGVYQFCTAVSHKCLYGVYQFCTAVSHQCLGHNAGWPSCLFVWCLPVLYSCFTSMFRQQCLPASLSPLLPSAWCL